MESARICAGDLIHLTRKRILGLIPTREDDDNTLGLPRYESETNPLNLPET